jgi:hypothetical protein
MLSISTSQTICMRLSPFHEQDPSRDSNQNSHTQRPTNQHLTIIKSRSSTINHPPQANFHDHSNISTISLKQFPPLPFPSVLSSILLTHAKHKNYPINPIHRCYPDVRLTPFTTIPALDPLTRGHLSLSSLHCLGGMSNSSRLLPPPQP